MNENTNNKNKKELLDFCDFLFPYHDIEINVITVEKYLDWKKREGKS